MLTQVVNKIGILFIVNFNGHDLHFQEWKATDDSIYYMPLSTLVDQWVCLCFKRWLSCPL